MGLAKFFAAAIGMLHSISLALSVFIFALAAAVRWLLGVTTLTVVYRYFFGMPGLRGETGSAWATI